MNKTHILNPSIKIPVGLVTGIFIEISWEENNIKPLAVAWIYPSI